MYFPIGSQLGRIHYGWAPRKPLELLLSATMAAILAYLLNKCT